MGDSEPFKKAQLDLKDLDEWKDAKTRGQLCSIILNIMTGCHVAQTGFELIKWGRMTLNF